MDIFEDLANASLFPQGYLGPGPACLEHIDLDHLPKAAPWQEARMKAWLEVQKEWDQGEPKWEVELDGIQICLQASQQAGGRFMLAADKATLAGRCLKGQQLNAIHLNMDKVPAPDQDHPSPCQPHAPSPWSS